MCRKFIRKTNIWLFIRKNTECITVDPINCLEVRYSMRLRYYSVPFRLTFSYLHTKAKLYTWFLYIGLSHKNGYAPLHENNFKVASDTYSWLSFSFWRFYTLLHEKESSSVIFFLNLNAFANSQHLHIQNYSLIPSKPLYFIIYN